LGTSCRVGVGGRHRAGHHPPCQWPSVCLDLLYGGGCTLPLRTLLHNSGPTHNCPPRKRSELCLLSCSTIPPGPSLGHFGPCLLPFSSDRVTPLSSSSSPSPLHHYFVIWLLLGSTGAIIQGVSFSPSLPSVRSVVPFPCAPIVRGTTVTESRYWHLPLLSPSLLSVTLIDVSLVLGSWMG
jgi:hypothetical protein